MHAYVCVSVRACVRVGGGQKAQKRSMRMEEEALAEQKHEGMVKHM